VTAAGRWFVTPHAVARYRERVDPDLSYEEALGRIIRDSERAAYVRPALDGREEWRSPERVRYVVAPPNGSGPLPSVVSAMPLRPLIQCEACGAEIEQTNRTQKACSKRCRERLREQRRMADPAHREERRTYQREYARKAGRAKRARPILQAAPHYPDHLPGAGCMMVLRPSPTWATTSLRGCHLLHGMLSSLLATAGDDHDPMRPQWALVPWSDGWGVWWWGMGRARYWCGTTHRARLGEQPVTVAFGPPLIPRTPEAAVGRRQLRVTALTPVVIAAAGRTKRYTAPCASRLVSTLTQTLAPRLGVDLVEDDLVLRLVERNTEPRSVVAGKFHVRGWAGSILVEGNAAARWLLQCAARGPGLGGRTALGFGRVVVEA